jgi:cell division protein FtsB
MFLVFLVMVVVAAASTVRAFSLQETSKELALTEATLEQQLTVAEQKSESLESREKYMQTTKYIEDQAKDKLGLVYPDEIVIKPNK